VKDDSAIEQLCFLKDFTSKSDHTDVGTRYERRRPLIIAKTQAHFANDNAVSSALFQVLNNPFIRANGACKPTKLVGIEVADPPTRIPLLLSIG
jgi:hypothetical protein